MDSEEQASEPEIEEKPLSKQVHLRPVERKKLMAFCLRFAKIAVMRATGATRHEMMTRLNLTHHVIDRDITYNGDFINELEAFVLERMPKQEEIQVDDTQYDAQSARDAAYSRIGTLLKVIDTAMAKGLNGGQLKMALDAAKELGKMTGLTTRQTITREGGFVDRKVLDVSPAMQKFMDKTMRRKELPPIFDLTDDGSGRG